MFSVMPSQLSQVKKNFMKKLSKNDRWWTIRAIVSIALPLFQIVKRAEKRQFGINEESESILLLSYKLPVMMQMQRRPTFWLPVDVDNKDAKVFW